MAMNANALAKAIKNTLVSHGYVLDDDDAKDECEAIWKLIAGKIISHIVNNAEVSTTVATGIAVQVDPTTGVGATTSSGMGTGGIS